jgi:transcriptional regulator with XRE-family HTH domain
MALKRPFIPAARVEPTSAKREPDLVVDSDASKMGDARRQNHRKAEAAAEALFAAQSDPVSTQIKTETLWFIRVGQFLRGLRKSRHLGQSDMAQLTGMHQPYISLLENGLLPQRGPSIHALTRYVQSANCDLELVARNKETGDVIAALSTADVETELRGKSSGSHVEAAAYDDLLRDYEGLNASEE